MKNLANIVGRGASLVASAFGPRDVLLFGGLALLGYGLSMVSPPAAFIVPGMILAGVSIFGVR